MQKTNVSPAPPPQKRTLPAGVLMQGRRDSPLRQSDFLPPSSTGTLSCLERHVQAEGWRGGGVDTFSFFRKACWELLKMAPIATSPSRFEKPCTSPGPPRWAAFRAVARHLFSMVTPGPTPLPISSLALGCYSRACRWAQRGSELQSTNIPQAAFAMAPDCG